MTPSELYTIVRNQCGESSTNFWSESEIYSLMGMGERIIAQVIGNIEVNTSITTVTSTKEYDVSSYVSGVLTRVEWDSYRLQGIDINEVDNVEGMAYGGVTQEGYPVYYYYYGNTIGLSPTPDDAKTLEFYYRTDPATVTTASVAFSIPDEYTQDISDYVLYRMFLKDQELQNEAILYKNQWNENVNRIRLHWNDRKKLDQPLFVNMWSPLVEE
jgi:hypothetical protein